jgi:hypothetical protein
MGETGTNSPMLLRGLEIMIRENFAGSGRVGPGASSDNEDVAEERELSDLCTLGEKDNEEEEHQENATEEATDEEAGKRRRDRLLTEAETMTVNREENNRRRVSRSSGCVAVGRSVSDCGDRRTDSSSSCWPAAAAALHRTTSSRNRSLTDEDMEELRGCIDLGFGFSNDEKDMELCNTLPALELCYAITKRYNDVVGRTSSSSSSSSSSPTTISTSQSSSSSSSSFDHHCSNGSSLQSSPPPMDSWRISSPGNKFFPSFLQAFSSTYLVRSC